MMTRDEVRRALEEHKVLSDQAEATERREPYLCINGHAGRAAVHCEGEHFYKEHYKFRLSREQIKEIYALA